MASLIPQDELTVLKPASEVKEVALAAHILHQFQTAAYNINTAANTGELRAIFIGDMYPEVKSKLEDEGYCVVKDPAAANPTYIISCI